MKSNSQLLDYSVVIRTLGTSGQKYENLLNSIERQTIQPREVVVVMALGYQCSPYHILGERIVWTRKGMVNQRQVGFEEAKSPFLLVVDDDIAFDNDFVERMYQSMLVTKADCIFPVSGYSGGGTIDRLRSFILGSKRYSRIKSPFYLRIGATGGTIVNSALNKQEPHWCQTANFQCFFIIREVALSVHLEDEMWLEETGYAWPDDQVFFYKTYLNGFKTLLTPDISYSHLDAKSGNVKKDKTYKDHYLHQRNIVIFWHRFLWMNAHGWRKRSQLILGITYKIIVNTLFYWIKCIVRGEFGFLFKSFDGVIDARRFINKKNK